MRRIEQMGAAVVEHGAPARRGRGNSETEEAHGGFGQDGSSHPDGGLHDHRLNNVGQNVANDDVQITGAKRPRGFDEFTFAGTQDLPANQASVAYPSSE